MTAGSNHQLAKAAAARQSQRCDGNVADNDQQRITTMHWWRAPLPSCCGHPDPHACAGPWLIIEPLAEVVGGIAIGAQVVRFLQHDPVPL